MEESNPVVIVSAVRTPLGKFQGSFKDLFASDLGSFAIAGAVDKAGLAKSEPEAVMMGCVLTAGLGQAPARQAAIKAELPTSVDCTTINKVCGSGMKAILFAHDILVARSLNIIIAGGMESMTNAPYLLPKARAGYRLGHQKVVDHMLYDGLEDAYEAGTVMGLFAEKCADHYRFSREEQDKFALNSIEKAQSATKNGGFADEIIPVKVISPKGEETEVSKDDGPLSAKPEKIPNLRPAFRKDGTVTAATSSSISDGASALTLMRLETADELGLKPLARIVAHATHSQEPAWFTTAPVFAIKKLLAKINWNVNDVDLWEINEAFAVVPMAVMKELNLPSEKINVHGGACILGHPIGASGARITTTLLHALSQKNLKKGIAALCIGGGEATAVAIELM